MARRAKTTFSLEGLLPSVGLRLVGTNPICNTMCQQFKAATQYTDRIVRVCPECKMPFIVSVFNHKQQFCCQAHAMKYTGRERAEKNKKLAWHIVDKNAFAKWFKEYNNKVIGYIYNNFDSELVEDLIDVWTDHAIIWYSKMWDRCKSKPFPFLKVALGRWAKLIKTRKKEVFYDECSMRVQNKILGEIVTER